MNRSLSLLFRGWHCLNITVQWSQWAKGNRDFHYELILDKHPWRCLVPVIPEFQNKDKCLKWFLTLAGVFFWEESILVCKGPGWLFPTFLSFFLFFFSFINLFTLQYIIGFTIHWHESAMGVHVFPIPNALPTSLPIPSLWVIPEHPVSCIEPGLAIHFTCNNLHVSIPFSHIILPSPSPRESKRLFYTSVSLLLSHIQDYHYHLSKFHIYALVYYIGVFFLAYFTLYNRLQFHPPH